MQFHLRLVCAVAICCAGSVALFAQDAKKPKVELRWVEAKKIAGVTEDEGFQTSCDPDSIMYPHKKPALVLTAEEVERTTLQHLDLSGNGLSSQNYQVTMHLTRAAREKLAATYEGKEMRYLTVLIDGKYWGLRRYEKVDKPGVPPVTLAENFTPDVGYFSSKGEALLLMDALAR
ncbi:hypothetical protein [Anatilimnocola floriformis]|uniref:hypothetical protein n=1 Tax=Anatilimnocola floriformis TaxID=2948575 RepID=UPI0020C39238|nr:hypothetical protein [Anatilimnocola floriformis]